MERLKAEYRLSFYQLLGSRGNETSRIKMELNFSYSFLLWVKRSNQPGLLQFWPSPSYTQDGSGNNKVACSSTGSTHMTLFWLTTVQIAPSIHFQKKSLAEVNAVPQDSIFFLFECWNQQASLLLVCSQFNLIWLILTLTKGSSVCEGKEHSQVAMCNEKKSNSILPG